jgi:hypothetical protein
MNIPLTWQDLLKLATHSKVDIGENTVTIGHPVQPDLYVSEDRSKGFVRFTVE